MIILICTAGDYSKYGEFLPKMQELDKAINNPHANETPEEFAESVFATASNLFIIVEGGALVAYAFVNINQFKHETYVSNLVVDPVQQNHGYGLSTMQAIVSYIDEKFDGDMSIKLDVESSNTPAKKIYDSLGFEVTFMTMVRKPHTKPKELRALKSLSLELLDRTGDISTGLLTRAISDAIMNPGDLCILDYAKVQDKQLILGLIDETYRRFINLLNVEDLRCKLVGDRFIIAYGVEGIDGLTTDNCPKHLGFMEGIGYLETNEKGTDINIHPVYTRNAVLLKVPFKPNTTE